MTSGLILGLVWGSDRQRGGEQQSQGLPRTLLVGFNKKR